MFPLVVGAVLGAPWVLSFAPVSWWWLGLVLVTALPWVALKTSRPWLAGLAFGWSAYGIGVSWLHISLHTYGGLPSPLAWAAVAAFTFYLALFSALAVWLYCRFFAKNPSPNATVFNALLWAALWTFFEWARGTLMTGFAWLGLGDAFVDSPFANLLPWLGNHGALFILMLLGHLLVSMVLGRQLRTAIVFGALVAGTAGLIQLPTPTQSAGTLPVVGVQTNVDQSIKFDPDLIVFNMQKAFALGDVAKQQLSGTGGLLVFPETVNPLVWTDTPVDWQTRFRDFATPNHTTVIMGSAIQEGPRYYNSIVMFQGDEALEDLEVPKTRHDKRHLVPFGEFIPLGFKWFVAMLNMPMGEFTSGTGPLQPFMVQGNALASTVCYEDIFSGEFARLVANSTQEPTAFVNLSNLAWFRQSWALDQHAQMGRTRSAEHRKPGLRVTNTGLSGLVDEKGRWVEKAAPGQALVWSGQIEGRLGQTFFAKWGDRLWFSIWGAVLLLLCVREWRLKAYNRAH
ncbi:MAG: apolipoprotein N-acyltransferase [Gammaproteobacteria bacterium]|uniref:apolipoprotein N-acyltransferase n=1 Tax=Limnobacter sp. TaxID=2003368 RepID=UPI001D9B2A1B|nr:apolipoprotein N-acyltransferase [Limnobacter sp.]MBU0784026.1 apolipoprotein N-acyltransferase [Gammaproteobacteria bacterium]MBU0848922.1 apolipoprotein N-acyltransferase [Gammaproteobacteria bacterium]MBU1268266.1 apolipoprotein N-acyltransferase [Gammaproteobacteria bacterium]MBU1527823.1 apolipoprotein N-acyltransferase [Gammaproteobacteria bacterium]MBU1778865.1 apolipoprotein N-acyltransferase [Gammaproteobacteria bacterium]